MLQQHPPRFILLLPTANLLFIFRRCATHTGGPIDRFRYLTDHTRVTKAGALSKSNHSSWIGPGQFRYSCPLLFGGWVLVYISGGFGIITIFNVTPGYHVMSLKHTTLAGYEGTADTRSGKKASEWGACFPLAVANSLYLSLSLCTSLCRPTQRRQIRRLAVVSRLPLLLFGITSAVYTLARLGIWDIWSYFLGLTHSKGDLAQ